MEHRAWPYAPAIRQYEDASTIAISDLVFYTGDAFPAWRNQLFFVSLKTGRLYRLAPDGERVADKALKLAVGGPYVLQVGKRKFAKVTLRASV